MKQTLITFIVLVLLSSCSRSENKRKENENKEKTRLEEYLSYSKDSVFDKERFLDDLNGDWICYKYVEDGEYYPNFLRDKKWADEFREYFYFRISNDTIISSIYKMPIDVSIVNIANLNKFAQATLNNIVKDSAYSSLNPIYKVHGENGMYYSQYWDLLIEQGDTIPYVEDIPLGGSIWCFPNYLVIDNYGYYWYFKKGVPNNKEIIGMPSNVNSRFIVNRTYENCSIKEAAYKLMEEFPKGTEALLIADDDPGESAEQELSFPTTSFELYSTVYKWEGQDKLTIRVGKNSNCTFVFEFNKQGNNVSVKYWNDVVSPFEKGYCSYN